MRKTAVMKQAKIKAPHTVYRVKIDVPDEHPIELIVFPKSDIHIESDVVAPSPHGSGYSPGHASAHALSVQPPGISKYAMSLLHTPFLTHTHMHLSPSAFFTHNVVIQMKRNNNAAPNRISLKCILNIFISR